MNKQELLDRLAAENAAMLQDLAEREANPREYWEAPDDKQPQIVTKDARGMAGVIYKRRDDARVEREGINPNMLIAYVDASIEDVVNDAAKILSEHRDEIAKLRERIAALDVQVTQLRNANGK